jgi:hypothetical protein
MKRVRVRSVRPVNVLAAGVVPVVAAVGIVVTVAGQGEAVAAVIAIVTERRVCV